ncbi:hypothetical protein E2C01_002799 [Portunus trituberculatus]|uniref:Uncharacterized protein n=1 Tax=Portunus trituberculatus TaxID=210409 RepID=A0A5B7CL95_PORTR|nr:hypothetical protein [Portunus trituberculatus]
MRCQKSSIGNISNDEHQMESLVQVERSVVPASVLAGVLKITQEAVNTGTLRDIPWPRSVTCLGRTSQATRSYRLVFVVACSTCCPPTLVLSSTIFHSLQLRQMP